MKHLNTYKIFESNIDIKHEIDDILLDLTDNGYEVDVVSVDTIYPTVSITINKSQYNSEFDDYDDIPFKIDDVLIDSLARCNDYLDSKDYKTVNLLQLCFDRADLSRTLSILKFKYFKTDKSDNYSGDFSFKKAGNIIRIDGVDCHVNLVASDTIWLRLYDYNKFNKLLDFSKRNKLGLFDIKLIYHKK